MVLKDKRMLITTLATGDLHQNLAAMPTLYTSSHSSFGETAAARGARATPHKNMHVVTIGILLPSKWWGKGVGK